MQARFVRRSTHRSVPVAVADGEAEWRGSMAVAPAAHIPSIRARFSRYGRSSLFKLIVAAALAVSIFGYITSAQRTAVTLGAGGWWLRMRKRDPLATPTTVTVNGNVLLGKTSPVSFTCVDLDWWPETKCDYGRCTWGRSSMLNVNLDGNRLRAALRALSPTFVRLGGSLSDFVRYEMSDSVDPVGCNASFGGPTLETRLGFPVDSGCLAASRWDAFHQLCRDTGCSIVFTINALAGLLQLRLCRCTAAPLHRCTAAPLHRRLCDVASATCRL